MSTIATHIFLGQPEGPQDVGGESKSGANRSDEEDDSFEIPTSDIDVVPSDIVVASSAAESDGGESVKLACSVLPTINVNRARVTRW